ncbi:MAG: hypothetical protein BGO98_28265 [Myxococcales bacterium 68-20]|nr:hypothetical protein [Myxococcales bacterium]OJY30604.1 MAG: hypothetical protein BGO98_28265 [Myxococcales bacterium 68-20]
MVRSAFTLVIPFIVFGSLAGCSGESPTRGTPDEAGRRADSGSSESEPGTADAGDAGLAPTKRTSLEVTIGDVARTLDLGEFVSEKGDAGQVLYIEAHEGGDPGCPAYSSATKRTLIVSDLPIGAPGDVFTKADGITVGLLDFEGDLLQGGGPVADATAVTITFVAIDGTSSVEIEVDATFDQGTAKGRIHATYCESLSNRPKS